MTPCRNQYQSSSSPLAAQVTVNSDRMTLSNMASMLDFTSSISTTTTNFQSTHLTKESLSSIIHDVLSILDEDDDVISSDSNDDMCGEEKSDLVRTQ
jgi:hypothetical protein